jgi:nucleoside-diphosphate-sugar epimerase
MEKNYPHQPMYLCADISELTSDTGWKLEISFEEGVRRILTAQKATQKNLWRNFVYYLCKPLI